MIKIKSLLDESVKDIEKEYSGVSQSGLADLFGRNVTKKDMGGFDPRYPKNMKPEKQIAKVGDIVTTFGIYTVKKDYKVVDVGKNGIFYSYGVIENTPEKMKEYNYKNTGKSKKGKSWEFDVHTKDILAVNGKKVDSIYEEPEKKSPKRKLYNDIMGIKTTKTGRRIY